MLTERTLFKSLVYFCKYHQKKASEAFQAIKEAFPYCKYSGATPYRWYAETNSVNDISPKKTTIPTHMKVDEELKMKIESELLKDSKTPAREMARKFCVSPSTILHYIYHVLGRRKAICNIVPHSLTNTMKKQRILFSQLQEILLDALKPINYINLITLDETWLYYNYNSKHCYIREIDEKPSIVRRQQGDEKVMLTAAFTAQGIAGLYYLPQQQTMTADFFKNTILSELYDWLGLGLGDSKDNPNQSD